jgi:hypothetical protein
MHFHGSTGVLRGAARLEVIPLKTIVGALEPTIMFDAAFRPASELVRARWKRIALAHRWAVSLVLGRRDIDAWVTPVRTVSSSMSAEAA